MLNLFDRKIDRTLDQLGCFLKSIGLELIIDSKEKNTTKLKMEFVKTNGMLPNSILSLQTGIYQDYLTRSIQYQYINSKIYFNSIVNIIENSPYYPLFGKNVIDRIHDLMIELNNPPYSNKMYFQF
jgi:hypothetical protein